MGLEEVIGLNGNLNASNTTILNLLPTEILTKLEGLITILKITSIVVIGYVIFLIIKWFLSIKRHRKINKIYKRVNEIDAKLDILLKRKPVKDEKLVEKKIEKKVKKKGFLGLFRKKRKSKK